MKHILFIVLALFAFNAVNAQSTVKKIDAKTYQAVRSNNSSNGASYVPTDIKYIDTDKKTYTVYKKVLTKGPRKGQEVYYIQKTSAKTGKLWWKEVKLD